MKPKVPELMRDRESLSGIRMGGVHADYRVVGLFPLEHAEGTFRGFKTKRYSKAFGNCVHRNGRFVDLQFLEQINRRLLSSCRSARHSFRSPLVRS